MRRILCVAAALAIVAGTGLTASAGHSCCKPAPRCCSHAKPSCGLFSLPKLQLPKLQLPKLPTFDLFGCSKKTTCCQPAPKVCSGGHAHGEHSHSHGEAVKAPKVEDAPPPPYEEKAPAPAPPKDDAKAEPAKKAAKAAKKPEKKA
jgi:hypothetical protein